MEAAKPTVRNGYIVRNGRGYSLEELKEAGLDLHQARKRGFAVDVLRQTKYEENVERLKSISKKELRKDKPAKKEKKSAKKG